MEVEVCVCALHNYSSLDSLKWLLLTAHTSLPSVPVPTHPAWIPPTMAPASFLSLFLSLFLPPSLSLSLTSPHFTLPLC